MIARFEFRAAIVLMLIAIATASMRLGEPFDLDVLDRQFNYLHAHFPQPSAHDVVIVGIDQQTTEILREPLALWHAHPLFWAPFSLVGDGSGV